MHWIGQRGSFIELILECADRKRRGWSCRVLLRFKWLIMLMRAHISLDSFQGYPLVNIQKAIEHDHRNSGFTHWKWWFSIAMLNYQRVCHYVIHSLQPQNDVGCPESSPLKIHSGQIGRDQIKDDVHKLRGHGPVALRFLNDFLHVWPDKGNMMPAETTWCFHGETFWSRLHLTVSRRTLPAPSFTVWESDWHRHPNFRMPPRNLGLLNNERPWIPMMWVKIWVLFTRWECLFCPFDPWKWWKVGSRMCVLFSHRIIHTHLEGNLCPYLAQKLQFPWNNLITQATPKGHHSRSKGPHGFAQKSWHSEGPARLRSRLDIMFVGKSYLIKKTCSWIGSVPWYARGENMNIFR